jgi:hypothetical protein
MIMGKADKEVIRGTGVAEKEGQPESIEDKGGVLAFIIRSSFSPASTHFITPAHFSQQVGFVVHKRGGEIKAHRHVPMERRLWDTTEVLFVKEGELEVDFYSEDDELRATRRLQEGDLLILLRGGHGFRFLKDTVLLEVKQGPYMGSEEKEFIE